MMSKYAILTALAISTVLVGICSQTVSAQRLASSYVPPAGPTLSPYLLFSRRPTGIYDNYHTFVKPRIDLRTTLRIQDQQLQYLNSNLQQVRGEVRTLSEVRDAGVAPTGVGSAYMNYSHYYPSATGR